MKQMTLRAAAKINLSLDVTGRREDGYHTLSSIFQGVTVYDTIELAVQDGAGITLTCDALGVPCDGHNLAWKAAAAMLDAAGMQRQIAIAESGSIAEAALRVNGVFEAAEKAAKEYLQNLALLEKQQRTIFEQTKQQAKEEGMAEARQELTKNAQYIKKLVDFYKANHPHEDL